ncbi:sodium:proton antiporter NhaD [Methylomonas sp. AM2-LC]|uniref:sodium:proton antiporter NhaD n=1 Tax=Methylomonas sp. AM2-LC TaxID=3153301 RepID=UPI0032642024
MNSKLFKFLSYAFLLFPTAAFAGETLEILNTPKSLDLTHHIIGYLSLAFTVLAYVAAMSEEVIELRKSKPMVLGSALVWFTICIYYAMHDEAKVAAVAFESNLLAYIELFLFTLVSMTYLNAMEERGIFNVLRIWLLNRQYSYRQLFWITGVLAFLLSTVISGMAVALLMGAVAAAVGKYKKEFVALACVNIIVATNAGGSLSPLGGISTLFVWQHKILHFYEFFSLAVPCLVDFLLPAAVMHFFVPKEIPIASTRSMLLRRGSKRIILLFIVTLIITVWSNVVLELPPAAGMMAGLGILEFFCFYLTRTKHEGKGKLDHVSQLQGVVTTDNRKQDFDIFKNIGNIDWDTLLFFYGAMMMIGALGFVGYLNAIAHFMFGMISPTIANISIGLSSAFVDNGTLMFAVLSMHPELPNGQWLLLTLTLGVGGSLLSIGSAPGVALLGQIKEGYTFAFHMRWMPVILLGYIASIVVHFWINARYF